VHIKACRGTTALRRKAVIHGTRQNLCREGPVATNLDRGSRCARQYGSFQKNYNQNHHLTLPVVFWAKTQRKSNHHLVRISHPPLHCSVLTTAEKEVSVDGRTDKETVIVTHRRILCSPKKEQGLASCYHMDEHEGWYAKRKSQTQKEKFCIISLICEI
jgi:hypothetical protein